VHGSERDPWRPGRRSWAALLVLVVLIVAGVPIVRAKQHRDELKALDAAAVRDVQLGPTADPRTEYLGPDGTVGIGLRNDSEQALILVGYQVRAPGFVAQKTKLRIKPDSIIGLDVPDTATCSPTLITKVAPLPIALTVRTSRGQLVTTTANLLEAVSPSLQQHAQQRCGFVNTVQALYVQTAVGPDLSSRTLTAALKVANLGRLPLTITAISASPGVEITTFPDLPLSLTYEPNDGQHSVTGLPLRLRLRITDCAVARSSPQGVEPRLLGEVTLKAVGATGAEELSYPLDPDGTFLRTACG
jgi:hypothetical protein